MKRVVAFAAAGALALSAFAGVAGAAPGNGNAYGKTIKTECGASYGQLVSQGKQAARADLHPGFTPSGAKGFVMNTASFAIHCG